MLLDVGPELHGEPSVPRMRPGWKRHEIGLPRPCFWSDFLSEISKAREVVSRAAFHRFLVYFVYVLLSFVAGVGKQEKPSV